MSTIRYQAVVPVEELFSFDHHDLLLATATSAAASTSDHHHHLLHYTHNHDYLTSYKPPQSNSSSTSSIASSDQCQSSPERQRFLSGEEQQHQQRAQQQQQQQHQSMMNLLVHSSHHYDPSRSSCHVVSSSSPSSSSAVVVVASSSSDQLSSSGESGYFDGSSYTDLQAIFEASDGTGGGGGGGGGGRHTSETPDHDEVDEHSWTYLEPVQLTSSSSSTAAATSSSVELHCWTTATSSEAAVSASSAVSPANVPTVVVIKDEPVSSSDYSSMPVQLIKREGEFNHHQHYDDPYCGGTIGCDMTEEDCDYEQQQHLPLPPVVPASFKTHHHHHPLPHSSSREDSGKGGLLPRLCHVCGETAGKHSYYGGQVCPSCRAFFRRSVQSKYSDVYTCSKSQSCPITLKTRKNCQFCRFRLCERAGMKRSWVLADGERRSGGGGTGGAKSKTIGTGTTSTPSPPSSSSPKMTKTKTSMAVVERLPTEPVLPLDREQARLIGEYVGMMDMVKSQTDDLNPNITSELARMVMDRRCRMSAESRRLLRSVLEQRARLYALNLPEFTSLSSQDQIALLESNLGPQIAFRLSTFFRSEIGWREQSEMMLGFKDASRLTTMVKEKEEDHRRWEYGQFLDNNSKERMEPILRRVRVIGQWAEDETSSCLLHLILLFSSDRLLSSSSSHQQQGQQGLRDRSYVEERQLFFATLLHRYLMSRHGRTKARARFAAAIDIISYCREEDEDDEGKMML